MQQQMHYPDVQSVMLFFAISSCTPAWIDKLKEGYADDAMAQ